MRHALIAVILCASAAPAAADEATDKAAAARLFDEGRAAMAAGKIEEACARFEASLVLDRAIGTKLNLADCLEKRGQLAAAHRLFDEAATEGAKAGKEGREDFARQRATALQAKLMRVTLIFTDEPPAGTAIRIDALDIAPATWKQRRYLMPGKLTVTIVVPDAEPFDVEVEGKAGELVDVRIPPLAKQPAGPGDTSAGGPGAIEPGAGAPLDTTPIPPRRSRTLSYIVGGGGVALLGTSLALGLAARSKFRGADCGTDAGLPDGVCTPEGQKETDSARTLADVGTGFAAAGLVAVGVGVYLFVRAGSDSGTSRDVAVVPAVSEDAVGVVVSFSR